MVEVVIIGAGPVGSYLAGILRNMDITVLERAPQVGHKACSGLISTNLDKFVKTPRDCIDHKVKGAVMRSPGGAELELRKKDTAAYVINRPRFYRWIAGRAEDKVKFSTAAKGFSIKGDKALLDTSKGKVSADVVIDCLTLTVSAEQKRAMETLKALRLVSSELGLATVLGVSNISFGLPSRPTLSAAFFAMALEAGLGAAIINPLEEKMMDAYRSAMVLLSADERAERYVSHYGDAVVKPAASEAKASNLPKV